MSLHRFGVLAHPTRPQTAPVCEQIAESLRSRGFEAWHFTRWTEDEVTAKIEADGAPDLIIAIGGDGAMLRAGRACSFCGVPVLGVNMGRLGFLTEIAPDEWSRALDTLLAGQYWIESRMMIQVAAQRGGETLISSDALNDAVISRGAELGLVQVMAYIDGGWTTTYTADALIIATPTGSTAYALACGGPILPPELRNILLVPVAPHLSLDRPIVLPEGAAVEIVVAEEQQTELFLAVDGIKLCDLQAGDRLQVKASDYTSRFVRLREKTYFYRSLLDRLEPRISSEPR
jgi:NAD+ kinase